MHNALLKQLSIVDDMLWLQSARDKSLLSSRLKLHEYLFKSLSGTSYSPLYSTEEANNSSITFPFTRAWENEYFQSAWEPMMNGGYSVINP